MKINIKGKQPLNLLGLLICTNIELNKVDIDNRMERHDNLLIEINIAINTLLTIDSNVTLM